MMNRKNIEYLKLNIRMCIWEILISLAAFLIWLIAEHIFDMPGDNCEILMIIITAFMWIRTVRKLVSRNMFESEAYLYQSLPVSYVCITFTKVGLGAAVLFPLMSFFAIIKRHENALWQQLAEGLLFAVMFSALIYIIQIYMAGQGTRKKRTLAPVYTGLAILVIILFLPVTLVIPGTNMYGAAAILAAADILLAAAAVKAMKRWYVLS